MAEDETERFRRGLYERRKAAGLSQRRLAEAVGVSHGAIVSWEYGHCPTAGNLSRLAEFFGTTMDELWGREGE